MERDALLYVLSTLAQTCAALAAFVGAIGVFRLQTIRDRRAGVERELRALAQPILGRDTFVPPITDVVSGLDRFKADSTLHDDDLPRAQAARARWEGFSPVYRRSRLTLFVFEAWNLLVILVALVGFNYLGSLKTWQGTFWALWAVAAVTAVVTFFCVVAWTGEGGQFSETLRNLGNRLRSAWRHAPPPS